MEIMLGDKELDARLAAARAAQERSRIAFITSTVISLSLLGLMYNSYLSIYRSFAFDHYYSHIASTTDRELKELEGTRWDESDKAKHIQEEALNTKKLQERLMGEWVASRFITFSPLGIRFGVGDAPVLGAFALLVVSSWYFFVTRRENYTISILLRDAWNTGNAEVRYRVYHEINSYTIFTNALYSNKSIRALNQPDPPDSYDGQYRSFRFTRGISNLFLHYLPFVALTFVIVLDLQSWRPFIDSPFRDPPDSPLHPFHRDQFGSLSRYVTAATAMLLTPYIFHVNYKIYRFTSGTESVLRQFRHNLLEQCPRPGRVMDELRDPDNRISAREYAILPAYVAESDASHDDLWPKIRDDFTGIWRAVLGLFARSRTQDRSIPPG